MSMTWQNKALRREINGREAVQGLEGEKNNEYI